MCEDKPLRFVETHPEYGTAEVTALDKAAATVEAARLWGAVWREIACECTVSRGRRVLEHYCRRCGRRIQAQGLCPECRAAEELARRAQALTGREDRVWGGMGEAPMRRTWERYLREDPPPPEGAQMSLF